MKYAIKFKYVCGEGNSDYKINKNKDTNQCESNLHHKYHDYHILIFKNPFTSAIVRFLLAN
jgi:hypothetical protein